MKITAAYRTLQAVWRTHGIKGLCVEHVTLAQRRKYKFHLVGVNLLGLRVMVGAHGRRMTEDELGEITNTLPAEHRKVEKV